MSEMVYYRWSDNDRRLSKRVIYSRAGKDGYCPLGVALTSRGDEDEQRFNTLRVSGFGHTLVFILPEIVKPTRNWVDTSHYEWSKGAGGYWDQHRVEYSFAWHSGEGDLHVHNGQQTGDSTTDKSWIWSAPWKQWRHVRRSFYGLKGEWLVDMPQWGGRPARTDFRIRHAAEDAIQAMVPTVTFAFADFDGEQLTATTRIEEREWRRGKRWCRFLSNFWSPKIRRSLDIQFSGETGKRKGSWKGGTIGHSIDMLPGELHEAAFGRYCAQHSMTLTSGRALEKEAGR